MSRRRWILPLSLLALFALFLSLRRAIGLEFEPDSMHAVIGNLGYWGPLAFVGIVAFRIPLGVPSALLLIGGGLVFGTARGTLYGAIGLILSALALFTASRWAGRPALEARVPTRLHYLLDVAGSRAGALFIALGSAYPMSPITSYHLIAGITGMPFLLFATAASVGCAARAALYTYFGSSLLEADPVRMLLSAGLLLAALLLPLALPTPRRWLLGALARPAPALAGDVAARSGPGSA